MESKIQNPKSRIHAIILAAGESRRMGQPKMLMPFRNSTILESVLDTVKESDVDFVTVVLGFHAALIRPLLAERPVEALTNPSPERGMLSSIQCALSRSKHQADAYLIVLGDQPELSLGTINLLIGALGAADGGILIPAYEGKRGHPVLIRSTLREEILGISVDRGLNSLMHLHPDEISEVPIETAEVLNDIDTPEDYRSAINRNDVI